MTTRRTARCAPILATVAAIGCASALTSTAPAGARPPAPLDPACSAWQATGPTFQLRQDNGILVDAELSGSNFGPSSTYTAPGKGGVNGPTTGNVGANLITFKVNWSNGFSNQYIGNIAPDGSASGFTTNNKGDRNNWTSTGVEFKCAPPPAAASGPAPVNTGPAPVNTGGGQPAGGAQQGTPAQTLQVKSDVDVYQSVNPRTGGVHKLGILRANNTVNVIGTCKPQDWCNVSGAAVPTGSGWAWGVNQG